MLIAKNLSFEGNSGPLFENVDLSLDSSAKKRVAIVGKNGCGKSTLLRILQGQIEPTAGTVSISREIVAYLNQNVTFEELADSDDLTVEKFLESKLEEDWMTYKIEMVLDEVGLVSSELSGINLKDLSGGQKVKVALAELLLTEPTILLLDEPTNHLDRATIEWLKDFVRQFAGTVAFISHDRDFINSVANQIWEITAGQRIEVYGTNYDDFLVERFRRYQKALQLYEFSQRERIELEKWLRENANHPKYKFTATVAQKKKALERMDRVAPPEPVADPRVKMHLLAATEKGSVLSLKIIKKSFDHREILKNIEIKLADSEKILVIGPNGSGKSTLLNIMSGEDKDFEGSLKLRNPQKIGYLKQFCQLDPEKTVIDEFGAKTAVEYGVRRQILSSYLFPTELVENKIKHLSFGQQRRLELAILLTNKPDVLFLDEPTNHLDIFLREDLERFLMEQNVAMAVISHDQYFIQKLGITHTLELR